jgi:hypothetical protein
MLSFSSASPGSTVRDGVDVEALAEELFLVENAVAREERAVHHANLVHRGSVS